MAGSFSLEQREKRNVQDSSAAKLSHPGPFTLAAHDLFKLLQNNHFSSFFNFLFAFSFQSIVSHLNDDTREETVHKLFGK